MTIQLPEHLERYVHDQVLAGRFRSEDDVIRDALERHRQAEPQPSRATSQADLSPEQAAGQELQRRLLAAGIVSEIKPPITDLEPYRNRKLIKVKGKPLSETIIEERR